MVRRTRPQADIDPGSCPICGGRNECVKSTGASGPCWCRSETFNFELLARAGNGKACICQRCLRESEQARDPAFTPLPKGKPPAAG